MRSASEKTIRGSKSTRMVYAKRAIDRAFDAGCLAGSKVSLAEWIEAGIVKEFWPNIKPEDMLKWALKEREYRLAYQCHVDLKCICGKIYTTTTRAISKNQGIACSQKCAKKLRPSKKRIIDPKFHLELTCACGTKYNTTTDKVARGWGVACSKKCARKLPRKKRITTC